MKLNVNSHKTEGTGFTQVANFKMDMNAKAARVLSDTLYKDKIGSIIREISCNAFDAHIEVGSPEVPFKVKLPDTFDPTFSVRDYGPGLSHEDIEGIYTTYFGSTKDNSNEGVGAFGLGSKTPFSYTDSFMVTSIHKGVKRIYNAFLDEGLPQISMFGNGAPTDEPDGLEVTVTIDPKDFNEFRESLIKQLRFFSVKPDAPVKWAQVDDTVFDVENFKYYKTSNSIMQGFFITQGPVGYPLDFDIVRDYIRNLNGSISPEENYFLDFLSGMSNHNRYGRNTNMHGAYIDMPIGTIEVTASREGISYTQDTLNNIYIALNKVRVQLADSVKQDLDDAFNNSKKEFYETWSNLPDFITSTIDRDDFNGKYYPFTLGRNNCIRLKLPFKYRELAVSEYLVEYASKAKKRGTAYCDGETRSDRTKFEDSEHPELVLMNLLDDWTVYYKDENYAFVTRSLEHNDCGRLFYIMELPGSLYDDFIKYMDGLVEPIRISTLPSPSTSRGSKGSSITNGETRAWFWLTAAAMRWEGLGKTLYARGCIQEFDQTIEDYDGLETLVCFPTMNNKLIVEDMPKSMLGIVYQFLKSNEDSAIGMPEKDIKRALKKNPSKFISFKDYFEKNKTAIADTFRNDLRQMVKQRYSVAYNDAIGENQFREMSVDCGTLEGFDDLTLSIDASTVSTVFSYNEILHHEYEDIFNKLDAPDLMTFKEQADKVFEANTIADVENGLEQLKIDFPSLITTVSEIKKVLKNPNNRKAFLKYMISNDKSHYSSTKLYIADPFDKSMYSSNNTWLFKDHDVAAEIIDEIA